MNKVIKIALVLSTALACTACTKSEFDVSKQDNTASIIVSALDNNGDGRLDPYEVLDALLIVENALGHAPNQAEVEAYYTEMEAASMADFTASFDLNKNGIIEVDETEEDGDILALMDTDADGIVSTEEVRAFDFEGIALASTDEIKERIDEIFAEKDKDQDGKIDLANEITAEEFGRFQEQDHDRDGYVTQMETFTFMEADNLPVRFEVRGSTAYMSGVITGALPATVLRLLHEHPEVDTIEMLIVPGSIDDEANLRAALYVHDSGISTKVNSRSMIASGGTDFFMAGSRRFVEPGAYLGVHSWGGGGVPAIDVPREDPVHQKYLDFYEIVGIPGEFYWYTLEAAPAEQMHMMTEEEILRYKVRTP